MEEKEKDLTAEQQLLELIEGQEKKEGEAVTKSADSSNERPAKKQAKTDLPITNRQTPMFSADVIKARMSFMMERLKMVSKGGDIEIALDAVNNILIFSICALFIFLGYEILIKPKYFEAIPEIVSLKKGIDAKADIFESRKDLDYYLERLDIRDIFTPKPEEVEKVEEVVEEVKPVSILDELIGHLKLVGLSPNAGDDGNMVMIEDTQSEITLFLMEGDTVSGAVIKKILSDRVILSDGEEERELR